MEQDNNRKPEKKKEHIRDKADQWIEKAEDFMDETSEKIHESDAYKKADKSMEKVTKNIFRKAGKLWGKSERYFKDKGKGKNTK